MIFRAIIGLGLIMILSGCINDETETVESGDPSLVNVTFKILDQFDQEAEDFVQGEAITFLLTLTNTSDKNLNFKFATGCQYLFKILNKDNEELNTPWNPQVCTEALTNFILKPNESKEHRVTNLNQTMFTSISPLEEAPLPVGTYTAEVSDFGVDLTLTKTFNIN